MLHRYIEEPSLQFGLNDHVCPKGGIFSYHPFDLNMIRPEKINLGIIGRSESVDAVLEWLDACKSNIEEKKSKNPHPNLFPNFCGFNKEIGFKSEVAFDDTYIRRINNSEFDDIIKGTTDLEKRIENIVELYLNEIKFLSQNKSPNVILCVLSENFITYIKENEIIPAEGDEDEDATPVPQSEENEDEDGAAEKEQNFRRLLKAKAMLYNVPIQIVRDRIVKPSGEMQDPATIAWNFFTALYYKASGTPWALIRRDISEATCFAGVSFYKSRDKKHIQTSIAQIFNELGKGVILRGEEITIHKDDPTPHLSEEQAFNLLDQSLREYKEAVRIFPKRLVLHKTSNFNDGEIYGFRQAAKKYYIDAVDLVTILPSDLRIYRERAYPPLRGTHISFTQKNHLLYTRGAVPYYETYPGKYIPRPIEVRLYSYDESPNLICDEILALTKMNWNNTQFDRRTPITIECARNVGEILKYIEPGGKMQLKYSFYM